MRIPTVVRPPNALSQAVRGQQCDDLICQLDLLPTVLDYADVAHPGAAWRDQQTPFPRGALRPLSSGPGISWLPALSGTTYQARDSVVIENDNVSLGVRQRSLVTDRYRLSCYAGMPDTESGELFDLQADRHECHNRWHDPAYADVRTDLQQRLLTAYTDDTPWQPVPAWNA